MSEDFTVMSARVTLPAKVVDSVTKQHLIVGEAQVDLSIDSLRVDEDTGQLYVLLDIEA